MEALLESFVVDAEIVLLFLNHVHTVTVYVREIGANNLRLVYQSYLDSNHVLRYVSIVYFIHDAIIESRVRVWDQIRGVRRGAFGISMDVPGLEIF